VRKDNGGMGFWDMAAFNEALVAKQFWRLMKNLASLVAQLLRAKYYPHGDIFMANLSSRPSYTWRSILGVTDVIL